MNLKFFMIFCVLFLHCSNQSYQYLIIDKNIEIGKIELTKKGIAAFYEIEILKGDKNTEYQFRLHGGKDNYISASMELIDKIITNQKGEGSVSGILKYRGRDTIRFNDIVDNNHTIMVVTEGKEIPIILSK